MNDCVKVHVPVRLIIRDGPRSSRRVDACVVQILSDVINGAFTNTRHNFELRQMLPMSGKNHIYYIRHAIFRPYILCQTRAPPPLDSETSLTGLTGLVIFCSPNNNNKNKNKYANIIISFFTFLNQGFSEMDNRLQCGAGSHLTPRALRLQLRL